MTTKARLDPLTMKDWQIAEAARADMKPFMALSAQGKRSLDLSGDPVAQVAAMTPHTAQTILEAIMRRVYQPA